MTKPEFTKLEQRLIDVVDGLLVLCSAKDESWQKVPKFVETIKQLREKRAQVSSQSVVRHQAKSNKSTMIVDVQAEKNTLLEYFDDALSLFKEFAVKEKDSNLTMILSTLKPSKLSLLNPLILITTLQSFAATVQDLNARKLADYGIETDWLPTLQSKLASYESMVSAKKTSIANRPQQTVNFKTIMQDIKELIASCTNLVPAYKKSMPEFYNSCRKLLTPKKKAVTNAIAETKTETVKVLKKTKVKTSKELLDTTPPSI